MRDPIDCKVGAQIKLYRTIKGLSQTKLGNIVGVTFQQIQKYEKGINRIGASRLWQFSKILGIPVGIFYATVENEDCKIETEEGVSIEDMSTNDQKDLLKLVRFYKKLPEVLKAVLFAIAKSMCQIANKAEPEEGSETVEIE